MMFHAVAAVAMLLAFVQTPIAAPGHAPAASARHAAPAPAPPTAAQNLAAPAAQTNCAGAPCDITPQHITVANPPAAIAVWPLHDRIAWAANLVLVLLGYVGIMLALSMLKKIERQTKYGEEAAEAAAKSADAALLHAQAIVHAERPWILVAAEPSRTAENGFVVTATNRGRTPAKIIALEEQIEFAADEAHLPEIPQYSQGESGAPFMPIILVPGESTQLKTFSRDEVKDLCGSEERLKRVESWEERIFLYGRVTYRDLITPEGEDRHETAWCCWYIHGRQKSGVVMTGTREYNLHT